LIIQQNYFSDLYPAKILKLNFLSAKSFFPSTSFFNRIKEFDIRMGRSRCLSKIMLKIRCEHIKSVELFFFGLFHIHCRSISGKKGPSRWVWHAIDTHVNVIVATLGPNRQLFLVSCLRSGYFCASPFYSPLWRSLYRR